MGSHFPSTASAGKTKELGCLINNVIIGGPPEAIHDQDRVMVEVLTMHENKERLEPTHTLDDRCAIGKCVHTRRPTQSLYFHCRQTTEGKVASGATAAVTQQSRECFCVKKKMEPLCY